MSLRIYLACPFPRAFDLARPMMKKLRDAGHTITCDWTEGLVEDPSHVRKAETELSREEQAKYARADLEGVRTADLVWALATDLGGTGMWWECGYMQALIDHDPRRSPMHPTRALVVSGPPRTIFTSLSARTFVTHDEALAYILTLKAIP
jgi:hypothetical protein